MNIREYIKDELRQHFNEYPPIFVPIALLQVNERWRNDIEKDEWTTEMNTAFVDDLITALQEKG